MKANELMIGDWVLVAECVADAHFRDYPDKIESIRDGLVGLESDGLETIVERIDPIPLTAEILEKNGFDVSDKEVMQYHFKEDGEDYHFSLRQMYDKDGSPHGYSFYAFNVLTIVDYVHQLQHAFILCGIDKEITI